MAVNWGTIPDWLSVVVNGAVAVAALVGLRRARRDVQRADDRAAAAERELRDDRRRRAVADQARLDLDLVNEVLQLHGSRVDEHVYLRPFEYGRIRASLAVLPPELLPLARAMYEEGSTDPTPSREAVTEDLHAAVRTLREKSFVSS